MERFHYALRAIAVVTATFLFGMILGGTCGCVAALIDPTFTSVLPWKQIEPVKRATIVGAVAGILGVFITFAAMMLQALADRRRRARED